jgi:hypothetical protein
MYGFVNYDSAWVWSISLSLQFVCVSVMFVKGRRLSGLCELTLMHKYLLLGEEFCYVCCVQYTKVSKT